MDSLIKALAFDDTVRIVAVITTETVHEAMRTHDTGPTASAALGRLLTATMLLGATKKGEERLTLQIDGDGPIGQLVATAENVGEIYGTVEHPHGEKPLRADGALDVGGAVGRGFITALRRIGVGEPYISAVPLVSGEIGDDVAAYLAESEQIQSAVGVGVRLSPEGVCVGAGGFLVQVLGGVTDDQLDVIESKLAKMKTLSTDIEAGATVTSIIETLTGGDFRVLEETPARYRCPRDRAFFNEQLKNLAPDTLNEAFGGTGKLEVICEFCRTSYEYTPEDLA